MGHHTREELFSNGFQVVNPYHFDVFPDRLASILVDLFKIKVLTFHTGNLIRRLEGETSKIVLQP